MPSPCLLPSLPKVVPFTLICYLFAPLLLLLFCLLALLFDHCPVCLHLSAPVASHSCTVGNFFGLVLLLWSSGCRLPACCGPVVQWSSGCVFCSLPLCWPSLLCCWAVSLWLTLICYLVAALLLFLLASACLLAFFGGRLQFIYAAGVALAPFSWGNSCGYIGSIVALALPAVLLWAVSLALGDLVVLGGGGIC